MLGNVTAEPLNVVHGRSLESAVDSHDTDAVELLDRLRQWQARHVRCWFVDQDRRTPNRGPW